MWLCRSFVLVIFPTILTRDLFLFKVKTFHMSPTIASVVKNFATDATTKLLHDGENCVIRKLFHKFSWIWENKYCCSCEQLFSISIDAMHCSQMVAQWLFIFHRFPTLIATDLMFIPTMNCLNVSLSVRLLSKLFSTEIALNTRFCHNDKFLRIETCNHYTLQTEHPGQTQLRKVFTIYRQYNQN